MIFYIMIIEVRNIVVLFLEKKKTNVSFAVISLKFHSVRYYILDISNLKKKIYTYICINILQDNEHFDIHHLRQKF